jgi:FkbM family methyltransferase
MAFSNAKSILRNVSGLSALKVLLLTARSSRPALRPLCTLLLRPFVRNGEISLTFKEAGRSFTVLLRLADEEGDLHSILEVVARRVYPLDDVYVPDLIIDGGGNIGLFSLLAAAKYPEAKVVICEPLPRNIKQIERHLSLNRVNAELLPVCMGGAKRIIPFYCRHANASSFEAAEPYESILEIDVVSLNDLLASSSANRVLIKLDIEGMEVEALESYVPCEQRSVVILGELHHQQELRAAFEQLFIKYGWSFQFGDLSGTDATFEARSPAAQQGHAAVSSKP